MWLQTLFLICAIFGGTLMVCQAVFSALGLGGDHGDGDVGSDVGGHDGPGHDVGHDEGSSSWFFGMLSLRALFAALTFFGLAGLAAIFAGLEPGPSLLIALGSGFAALYLVASMMRFLSGLSEDTTFRIERSLGETGTVYLKIPGHKAGAGKVTLIVQSRSIEYQAVTTHEEIPTGTRITVVAVVSPDTVEVVPATVETPAHV